MEWVLLFCLVVIIAFTILTLRKLDRMEEQHRFIINQLRMLLPSQHRIKSEFRSEGSPGVERAVTTRRDSNDLPATGRMKQGVHFTRRDFDRINPDSGLPESPGDL